MPDSLQRLLLVCCRSTCAAPCAQTELGISQVLYGSNLTANGYPNPLNDSRAPDIIIQAVAGPSDALQEKHSLNTT